MIKTDLFQDSKAYGSQYTPPRLRMWRGGGTLAYHEEALEPTSSTENAQHHRRRDGKAVDHLSRSRTKPALKKPGTDQHNKDSTW